MSYSTIASSETIKGYHILVICFLFLFHISLFLLLTQIKTEKKKNVPHNKKKISNPTRNSKFHFDFDCCNRILHKQIRWNKLFCFVYSSYFLAAKPTPNRYYLILKWIEDVICTEPHWTTTIIETRSFEYTNESQNEIKSKRRRRKHIQSKNQIVTCTGGDEETGDDEVAATRFVSGERSISPDQTLRLPSL